MQKILNWDLDIYKFGLSVCYWRHPTIVVSWAQHYPQRGGNSEDWAVWMLQIGRLWMEKKWWRYDRYA